MAVDNRLSTVVDTCLSEAAGKAELQVCVSSHETYVTRFSKTEVFQDLGQHDVDVALKAVVAGKEYLVDTNRIDPDSLRRATRLAIEGASKWGWPNPVGLPTPQPVPEVSAHCQATLDSGTEERSALVGSVLERCREKSVEASGLLSLRKREIMIANTTGVSVRTPMTEAVFNLVASSPTSTGYASMVSKRLSDLDAVELVDRAAEKCLGSQDPVRLEPGTYEVILEPSATASILLWLSYIGFGVFGARAAAAGSSILYDRMGEQLFGDNVTIYDDATAPDTLSMPFDFEGTSKRRTELVNRGVPMGVVHDCKSAHEFGVKSTGHCMPYPDVGPTPLNMYMQGGDSSLQEMIKSTSRGVLVTRFHGAITTLDPAELLLSGTTRDGTFLVEDGQVKCGIKPLRWTDSIVSAFNDIELLGKDTELSLPPQDLLTVSAFRVPAMKLRRFRFTDVQEY